MANILDIKRRIRSVINTRQITKAMKMVSAAKLRRAQDRTIASRPYASLLRKVLGNVAAAVASDDQGSPNPLLARREENRILLVLITGDKVIPDSSAILDWLEETRPEPALLPKSAKSVRW